MSHREAHHISRVRYQRRVDRFRDHATHMPYDDLNKIIREYEDDVGKFELFLTRLGLVHEPAHIAAYRLERNARKPPYEK